MKHIQTFLRPRPLALTLLALFVMIQFVPIWASQTNPEIRMEPNWPSAEVRAIVKRSCFDCHSNETVWPLYAHVAPVSWLVTSDVLRGRRKLNFSDWRAHDEQDEIAEVVENGEMPPRAYTALHPEALLSKADQQIVISAFEAQALAPMHSQAATPHESDYISAQRAAHIALAYHSQSEVREVKLEKERGVAAYEVRFVDGSEVYVAATTGHVVYAKIERAEDD